MVTLAEATQKTQLKKIKKLYKEAFPKCERKPFSLMLKKQKQGFFDIFSIESDKKEFLGFAIVIKCGDIALLDYFAFLPEARGMGYGTTALLMLFKKYKGKKIVLEIEPADPTLPDFESRKKRLDFYLKNNIKRTGLLVSLFGVPLEVLASDEISFLEYHKIFEQVFSKKVAERVKLIDTSFIL